MLYAGLPQYPRCEGVAVRPRPVAVALAVRIGLYLTKDGEDAARRIALSLRGEARRAAADTLVRMLEVAVHMADADPARVLRLPYFPALRGIFFKDYEPIMHREGTNER